ncbi:MAG: hypothetical protein F6K11_08490 [Leptolyngbya sp. SIO3F4]|nr:hypothetical protein [Leptolyngbya sp. SIO3F4]
MKLWRWGWLGLVVLASACSPNQALETSTTDSTTETSSATELVSVEQPAIERISCAPMESQIPLQPDVDGELPFERFNFRPTEATATEDTVTFHGERYSFTFCKSDRTWGVKALEPAIEAEEDYATYFEALSDPEYEAITSNDQTYRARVRLDASWLDDQATSSDNLEQVIFELVKPGDSLTTSKVLYTNNEIIEQELGASAGVPEITRSLATDDALWWAVGFEQGEGASGITTIVQYDIDTDEITLWQPSELGNAQITDLAVTGKDKDLTLWLGTQYSGEGNPYLPAFGLVAYSPTKNTVKTYTTDSSPMIGAIPTRIQTDMELLWVATADGACEVDWASMDSTDSWACWRFTIMADIPAKQELYGSLLAETAIDTVETSGPVELLWVTDTNISTPEATLRYEMRYTPGITTQLDQGADYYVGPEEQPDDGYFWWPGKDWTWNGERFIRYRDQVATNYVGGGPQGIGSNDYENYIVDWNTMRGEFELLQLTPESTEIKYYSAWIDGAEIKPWITVNEVETPSLTQENPTDKVLIELKQPTQPEAESIDN